MRTRYCLTSAKYNMTLDLLSETVTQDPISGAIVRSYTTTSKGVGCMVRDAMGTGSTERFGEIYENVDWLYADVSKSNGVDKEYRVTNIKDASGTLVWAESDGTATTFDVLGISPRIDAFGNHTEDRLLLKRSDSQ